MTPSPRPPARGPRAPLSTRLTAAIIRLRDDLTAAKGPYLTVARTDVVALRKLLMEVRRAH